MTKPTKQKLEALYWNQGLALSQIGELFGVYASTVRNWMMSYSIPRRQPGNDGWKTPVKKGSRLSDEHRKAISAAQKKLIAEGKRRYDGEHSPAWKGGPVTVNCGWCGTEMQVPRSYLKHVDQTFCKGKDCRAQWMSIALKKRRYDKPHYGSQELECDNCGKVFRRQNHLVKKTKNKLCSICTLDRRNHQTPKRKMNQSVELACDNCGITFERKNHRDKGQKYLFCTPECKKAFMRGDKIYNYVGGYEPYYGPNWREQRRKARERDNYTCQHCGIHQSELDRALDVHHIISFRVFGLENYIQANDLENLISLCQSCHSSITTNSHKA